MLNSKQPLTDEMNKFRDSVHRIQIQYNLFSKYLDDDYKKIYADAYVGLDEIANILEEKFEEIESGC